ncbi:hypothetical protein [Hydrocarboniphaga effusa]|uniref:hypothetical protein n=1 Tax=Hydrocarboniphaga effusa TaxID=243629 RepID=UPI003BA8E81A
MSKLRDALDQIAKEKAEIQARESVAVAPKPPTLRELADKCVFSVIDPTVNRLAPDLEAHGITWVPSYVAAPAFELSLGLKGTRRKAEISILFHQDDLTLRTRGSGAGEQMSSAPKKIVYAKFDSAALEDALVSAASWLLRG